MKKTTKKSAAKVSRKRALKNLEVKPAKGGTVRGGDKAVRKGDGFVGFGDIKGESTDQR